MGKSLAIRGHDTRGDEVIELLEMLGGKNCFHLHGLFSEHSYYFIGGLHNDEIRAGEYMFDEYAVLQMIDDMCFFTLEEFLEKYPYKVGDKIPDVWGDSLTVKSMSWDENYKTVMYGFKETIFVARGDEMYLTNVVNNAGLKIEKNMNTNIEFDLTKYSYEIKEGKLVVSEKKPKYPKTYEECIASMQLQDLMVEGRCGYEWRLVSNLQKLLLCRNAYWKIAGEQMGLDKPWEPDWKNGAETKYTIVYSCSMILNGTTNLENKILAFPTKEMRDAFYENFKNEIEQCKELL